MIRSYGEAVFSIKPMLEEKISVMEKNKELEFKSFKLESDDFEERDEPRHPSPLTN